MSYTILLTYVALCAALFIITIFLGRGKGVPVFLYHQINELIKANPAVLASHFDYLHKKGVHTFTANEAYDIIKNGNKLPLNSLLITFDDGYYDNYLNVFPLLKKYNLKATFFLNTAYIAEGPVDRTNFEIQHSDHVNNEAVKNLYLTGNGQSAQYMTWTEIKEMKASGLCEFQAHTHTHKCIPAKMKLSGIVDPEHPNLDALHTYEGKLEAGYPILKTRSEVTTKRLELKPEFYTAFLAATKGLEGKKAKDAGRAFVKKEGSKYLLGVEHKKEALQRITQEMYTNKHLIELHLQNKVSFFAWPWGIYAGFSQKMLHDDMGFRGFFTCIKGTNAREVNFAKVKRVELRNPKLSNFKITHALLQNRTLGFLYGLVS